MLCCRAIIQNMNHYIFAIGNFVEYNLFHPIFAQYTLAILISENQEF